MKKIILLLLITAGVVFFAGPGLAITYQPDPADMYDLSHPYYYTWTIDISEVLEQGNLSDARLEFNDIRNNNEEENRLFVHLLDGEGEPGLVYDLDDTYPDYSMISDQFSGQGILLFEQSFSTEPTDFVYYFTEDDVAVLQEYAVDGIIAFGLDPDCHFYNNGVSFSVPEPGVAALLFPAFCGIAFIRRRFF